MSHMRRTNCPKLLRQVNNRPHASSDDHEDYPTQRPMLDFEKADLTHPNAGSAGRFNKATVSAAPRARNVQLMPSPPKRQLDEVIQLPSKKRKTEIPAEGIARAKHRVTMSLPSQIKSDGLNRIENRTRTREMDSNFDADPESSSDGESFLSRAEQKRSSDRSMNTTRTSLSSSRSSAIGGGKSTKRDGVGNNAGFKALPRPDFLASRKNDTITKQKFKKSPPLSKMVGDEELESSDGDIFDETHYNIHAKKKQKRSRSAPRSSQQSAGYGRKAAHPRPILPPKHKAPPLPPKPFPRAERIFQRHEPQKILSTQTAPHNSYATADDISFEYDFPLPDLTTEPAEADDGEIECTICRERIRKMLREEFEDEILKRRSWSYKWQQRFCTWHKTRKMREIYRERGYPEIDWSCLRRRMRKHDKILSAVLNDQTNSYHRDRLRCDAKSGSSRQKDKVAEGTSRFTMGYYGPRGEQRVNDYIMHRFADDLRHRSTQDQLILASGIQGGVNGFVQLVLAPHLVELLVKEDLGLTQEDWDVRARKVLAESAEIGELLHPEEEDKVGENGYEEHAAGSESDDGMSDLAK